MSALREPLPPGELPSWAVNLLPWGPVQYWYAIAEGIVQVSTASHGGILLSPARWDEFGDKLRDFVPWAGIQAFEEDCDAAAVIMVWPDLFSEKAAYFAVRSYAGADSFNGQMVANFLAKPAGARVLEMSKAFRETLGDKWERGGCGTSGGGWFVFLYRGQEKQTVTFKDYPAEDFYSDAEIQALRVDGKEAVIA